MKIKSIWLAIIVIALFLSVHAGYNYPDDSLFSGLLWVIKEYGFTGGFDDLPLQFLVTASFLITVAILEKKKLAIIWIILMVMLLGFWYYTLKDSIEFDFLSMIPFAVGSVIAVFFWQSQYIKKASKNESRNNSSLH